MSSKWWTAFPLVRCVDMSLGSGREGYRITPPCFLAECRKKAADCSRCCAAFHELSVYPKKELPFFILFTAGLCSFTALLALLTYQYPEPMGLVAKTVAICRSTQLQSLYD